MPFFKNPSGEGRRLRVSYRISLIVALPLLVLSACGLIVYRSFSTASTNVEALARTFFNSVSKQAGEQSRRLIGNGLQTVQELQEIAAQKLLSDDPHTLARQLLPVLRAHPEYSWISYSREDGTFLGVSRTADGVLLVNHSWIDGARVILDEFHVSTSGDWKLARHNDDHRYDPRTRDFYKLAVAQGRGAWTQPYVFYDGVPGITYAAPRVDSSGKLLGVFTVDFNLNGLAEIMRQVRIAETGEMFMVTESGVLLAHPRVSVVSNIDPKQNRLKTIADMANPVLEAFSGAQRASAAAHVSKVPGQPVPLEFKVNGEAYLGAYAVIHIDDGLEPLLCVASPRAEFLGATDASLRASMLVAIVGVCIAMALAVIFASTVARPLERMAGEMDRVGQFYLDAGKERSSVFSEIDTMERSLRHMKASLRGFAAYVPRDLVRKQLLSGHDACLGGETRVLTIYFSDIEGFTSFAENLAPDELVRQLGEYFEAVGSIISSNRGTLDKFLGDGVMAFWGAPEQLPLPALDAVRAALDVNRQLRALRGTSNVFTLNTRIGLATGPVLVGNIGTAERLNYTVMGDSANLASRLEALNKVYGTSILIDHPTREALGDAVLCRPVDVVSVKGKVKDQQVYEPLCLAGDAQAASAKSICDAASDALRDYLAGHVKEAHAKYARMVEANPIDTASIVMRDKCAQYLKTGIPENWSGITRFLTK